MNPLKNLLQMLDNGFSSYELDILNKLEKIFSALKDEKYIVRKQENGDIAIHNTYSYITLSNNAQIMKVSFDIRLIPDIVANITLRLRQAHPELIIMESYMEDTDNNQLIFGQQKINEYLTFRVVGKKAIDNKEKFIN